MFQLRNGKGKIKSINFAVVLTKYECIQQKSFMK